MPISREHSTASAASSHSGAGIRTTLRMGAGTQVCADAELKGEIAIGQKCFVHPKARIIAEAGPIIIGDGNVIEELAQIVNELVWLACSLQIASVFNFGQPESFIS